MAGRHDVAIVGAGASGCSIAAHLLRREPTLSVAILDRAHVGAGSTSRSTAAFRHQWSIPAHVAFSSYSREEYAGLERRGAPIGFRRNGYLFLHRDAGAVERARSRIDAMREAGVRGVEFLRPDQVVDRVPIGRALDAGSFAGASWGPDDGFLDPLAVAQAYLDEARAGGALYRPGHRVRTVRVERGRVSALEVDGGDVAAGAVVLAAGVWGVDLASRAGLGLPVRPAKRHLYHTRPVRGRDVADWPLTIGDRGQHVRPAEGNTLMLAWERSPAPLDPSPDEDALWTGQDEPDPGFGIAVDDYGGELLAAMARHVPCLAEDTALRRVTCGWYAIAPDHKAILGEDPRCRGLFHACGFSGHGVMHAAATGAVVADRVLGRPCDLVPDDDLDRQFGLTALLDGRLREPVEVMTL